VPYRYSSQQPWRRSPWHTSVPFPLASQLRGIEDAAIREAEIAWAHTYGGAKSKNTRWEEIQRHAASENPNDWRLAIIEADILLEEALEKAGFVGASVGDRLKSASGTSYQTIQDAWDAHKIRNQIAHTGSDFVLTKKIAQEAIIKFERVFQEFGVI